MLRMQIELKRKEMLFLAETYGFTADVTVQCSQELDLLLNRLQKRCILQQNNFNL